MAHPGSESSRTTFLSLTSHNPYPRPNGPYAGILLIFALAGCVGFGLIFGRWLWLDEHRAYQKALILGIVSLFLFVVVRVARGFGNIHPPESLSWMDLLNVTKYPPSLAFLLLTLGIVLVCLFFLSRSDKSLKSWGNPLLVFGRSALVFYILHLYVFGIVGLFFAPQGTGIPLMYIFWLCGLVLLYPLCLWYGKFKSGKAQESLWRFF